MSHGPVGDDTSAIFDDAEFDSGHSAVRIASVAALGGLLFGYDSAVINGAVKSIQLHFAVDDKSLGMPWPRRCSVRPSAP
ncbi:sugar porter family MFS transporter [Mycolicibacterium aubagnense]